VLKRAKLMMKEVDRPKKLSAKQRAARRLGIQPPLPAIGFAARRSTDSNSTSNTPEHDQRHESLHNRRKTEGVQISLAELVTHDGQRYIGIPRDTFNSWVMSMQRDLPWRTVALEGMEAALRKTFRDCDSDVTTFYSL
jgi:hypothetical protein